MYYKIMNMEKLDSLIEDDRKYLFKDDDTYALRELKTLAEKQMLLKFCNTLEIPHLFYSFHKYMYDSIAFVKNSTIFQLRTIMQPSKWYYFNNETLPGPIAFNTVYTLEDFYAKDSIGHTLLKEKIIEYGYNRLSSMYSISIDTLKNMIYKRKYNNKEIFKVFPSFRTIRLLRDIILPDYWYIYEDELVV